MGATHRLSYPDAPPEPAVAVGDTITVTLPQTLPSRWEPAVDRHRLRLTGDATEAAAIPRGAAAGRTFTFEVLQVPAELRLIRRRPWEQVIREEYSVTLRAG